MKRKHGALDTIAKSWPSGGPTVKSNREQVSVAKGEAHARQAALQVWTGEARERCPDSVRRAWQGLAELASPRCLPPPLKVIPGRAGLAPPLRSGR